MSTQDAENVAQLVAEVINKKNNRKLIIQLTALGISTCSILVGMGISVGGWQNFRYSTVLILAKHTNEIEQNSMDIARLMGQNDVPYNKVGNNFLRSLYNQSIKTK